MGRAAVGNIRRLPSGRYQARFEFPDGLRRPAPTTFTTKKDASAWLAQMHADVSRGVWTTNDATVAISLREYSERWVRTRKVKGRPLADRTRATYDDLLSRFILPSLGHLPLHTVTREQVDRWYEAVAPGLATTRAKSHSLLRSILTTAVDDG